MGQFWISPANISWGPFLTGIQKKKLQRPHRDVPGMTPIYGGLTIRIYEWIQWKDTLWQTYKKLLKMAIEIVDLPMNNGDFP